MSVFRSLLPEFAYFCPSPNLRRKLSLAVAFSTFGLVAGASGVALLVAGDDSDPRSAFALASPPPPDVESATTTAAADMPMAETVVALKAAKLEAAKLEAAKVEVIKPRQPEVVRAVTAPRATREVPVGHSSEPAEAAPRAATFIANAPAPEEGTVTPTDATVPAPAAEAPLRAAPLRATPAATPRKTARHQGRRSAPYQQFSLWPFGGLFGR